MKTIRLHARGGPEAFAYEEAPQPHPGEGEVLVRVRAAGVIPTELLWQTSQTTRSRTASRVAARYCGTRDSSDRHI